MQVRARRAAAKRATERRRNVLAGILLVTLVVVGPAAFHAVAWPYVAIPLLLLAAWSTALAWSGDSQGCLLRIRATIALTWGAAKLLPVAVIDPRSAQATSTSIPRAPNSTGGWAL